MPRCNWYFPVALLSIPGPVDLRRLLRPRLTLKDASVAPLHIGEGGHIEDIDNEHVAGLGALDGNRAREVMDAREVHVLPSVSSSSPPALYTLSSSVTVLPLHSLPVHVSFCHVRLRSTHLDIIRVVIVANLSTRPIVAFDLEHLARLDRAVSGNVGAEGVSTLSPKADPKADPKAAARLSKPNDDSLPAVVQPLLPDLRLERVDLDDGPGLVGLWCHVACVAGVMRAGEVCRLKSRCKLHSTML